MLAFGHDHNGKDTREVEFTISNRTLIRAIVIILITIVLVEAIIKIETSILLLFMAFFLALALNAPVSWIARHLPGKVRGSRLIATTISYLIVVIALGLFGAYIIPPFVHQTAKFIAAAPNLVKDTQNQHTSLGQFVRLHHLQATVNEISKQISVRLKNIGGAAFSSIESIVKDIFALLAVLVLTFMMLVEGPRWQRILRDIFVPNKDERSLNRVAGEMYKVIKGYINGQVLLALIAAIMIGPALFIMHVSYPIALMVVVFICGLIPLFGHTIGAVILTIIALFHSVSAAIVVLIWYIIYINIENYLLQPKIQANTTNMSPLLVFAAVIIGINFGGIVGGLIAIPVAGVLRVLVIELLKHRNILPKNYLSENSSKD